MRVLIKGGLWKNTEDEILKAAVMKYGLNQWNRIASLLVRKSPKQCKTRWNEWLAPSIKKTEWSREENEKLLHAAKILPTQWRTISGIVGRTPSQCLEQYEHLLTKAQREAGKIEGVQTQPIAGDFEVHPENRPAQPDPIDMDPDEKEMLSEARARLANTKGKKAKRKMREKQLIEARRLASLQKRRELRTAGIIVNNRKRRKHWIDYNKEIPFQIKAPRGLYDTMEEDKRARQITKDSQNNFQRKFISDIEGERRTDIENREKKKDIKKYNIWRKHNLPEVIEAEKRFNSVEQIRQRPTMNLPTAQVTARDIEEISRLQERRTADGNEEGVTSLLVSGGDIPTSSKVDVRTPSTGLALQNEVNYLIELTNQQTPLIGGENPVIPSTDMSANSDLRTPNLFLTGGSMNTPGINTPGSRMSTPGFATPGSRMSTPGMSTPGLTPKSDTLRINTPSKTGGRKNKRGMKRKRKQIKEKFGMLPEPHNDYEIKRPQVEAEQMMTQKVEDQLDIEARKEQEALRKKEHEMKRRSQTMQRDLDRPKRVNKAMRSFPGENVFLAQAAESIKEEIVTLIQHDNEAYPLDGRNPKKRRKHRRLEYRDEDLMKSRQIVQTEIDEMQKEKAESQIIGFDEFAQQSGDACLYIPSKEKFDFLKNCNIRERLESVGQEFSLLRQQLEVKMKKSHKMEKKLNILVGGFQKHEQKARKALAKGIQDYIITTREVQVFKSLEKAERIAMPARLRQWRELVAREKEREQEAQAKYNFVTQEVQYYENLSKKQN